MDIPEILKQLEVNEGTFPREAVAQASTQREAMTPELLRILEYAHQNIEDIAERPDYFAHIYAMYLLAQFRERRAYPLIFDFFSVHGDIAVDTTGDVATEDLGRILASVSCGDTSLMTSLVENEQVRRSSRIFRVYSEGKLPGTTFHLCGTVWFRVARTYTLRKSMRILNKHTKMI
jgi:hypothetical protein